MERRGRLEAILHKVQNSIKWEVKKNEVSSVKIFYVVLVVGSAQPNARVVLGRLGEIGVHTAAETGPLKAADIICSSRLPLRMFQTINKPSSVIPGFSDAGKGVDEDTYLY